MIELNFLEANLSKSKIITKDDVLVRELLELCSNYERIRTDLQSLMNSLDKFKAHHFIEVYKEINKGLHGDDNAITKDMINAQYIIDNLEAIKQCVFIDDEEIY